MAEGMKECDNLFLKVGRQTKLLTEDVVRRNDHLSYFLDKDFVLDEVPVG